MTSSAWLDDIGYEAAEYDDSEAAEYDDSESEDAESRASDARRRRAQRVAVAQRRAQARAAMRGRPPVPRPTTPRAAVSAIRSLDLETKVQEDRFRTGMAAASKRMSRSEYAAVAGAAVNQFIESFQAPDNPFFRAALRFSPLLLLSPQSRGTGVEGFARDPRVVGGATVAAITLLGENRNRFSQAATIDVLAPSQLTTGQTDRFAADVFDRAGRPVPGEVTWSSDNTSVVSIDSKTGVVTVGDTPGTAIVTAELGTARRRIRVTTVAPPEDMKAPAQSGAPARSK